MTAVSREFQIFTKPVGARCNLKCSYCYYLDKEKLYLHAKHKAMPDDILEKYVIQHISATTDDVIFFSWHGGEPLLAGLEFYRRVIEIQNINCPAGKRIINGIQTNGTLLDEEWCKFLSDNEFITGISIDGPAELHDRHRKTFSGKNSHQGIVRGYNLLRKHGINPEILCVVSSTNVKYPVDVYAHFRELGAEYITFLPLVERIDIHTESVSERSVGSCDFGLFLSAIFDEWQTEDIGRIKIQIIEEAVRTAFNQEHTLCIFKERCGGVPVVESNGDFYSCDHYVDSEHLLGNIAEHPLSFFLDHPGQKSFGDLKLNTLPAYCLSCDVREMCNGECPKNRFIKTPEGENGLNYLCEGYKYFFRHIQPFVSAVKKEWNENL